MTVAEVLIVEDDEDIAALLAHRVSRQGHHPTIARTGADALVRARDARPDLVLLDLGLPDMDGWDVLDGLRHEDHLVAVPVLVVSVADEVLPPDHRVLGHITKPFSAADLDRRIADALAPPTTDREPRS